MVGWANGHAFAEPSRAGPWATASRMQGRLTYAPGLRLGSAYPGVMPGGAPLVPGEVAPPAPPPVAPSAPDGAPSGVMVGARRVGNDSENNSAGGDYGNTYGGPGPSGAPSTGSFLSDLSAFGQVAGPAALGLAGGPLGVVGVTGGLMAAGIANALGYPETASQFARSAGLRGEAVEAGAFGGGPKGGYSATDIGAPLGGWGNQTGTKPDALAPDGGGGSTGSHGGVSTGSSNDMGGGGDFGAVGDYGTGAYGGGGDSGSSSPGGDSHGGTSTGSSNDGWMRGGYTGPGSDGRVQPNRIAGRVHEGEVVIPAHQVARYGLDPLLMIARGNVAPSRLMQLMAADGGGRVPFLPFATP